MKRKWGVDMLKRMAVLSVLFVAFSANGVWAEKSSEAEKAEQHSKQPEAPPPSEFYKPLSRGPVGRFQAVRVEDNSVFILDTKEGHYWIWGGSGSSGAVSLIYGGRVRPGKRMGEIIESLSLKPQEGRYLAPPKN
ncbi:MAG: hypothetical protein PVG99_06280 [Desulfobacteraceae bacterium]|jgi:hypothetical protein